MAFDVKEHIFVHQSGFKECNDSVTVAVVNTVIYRLQFYQGDAPVRLRIHDSNGGVPAALRQAVGSLQEKNENAEFPDSGIHESSGYQEE